MLLDKNKVAFLNDLFVSKTKINSSYFDSERKQKHGLIKFYIKKFQSFKKREIIFLIVKINYLKEENIIFNSMDHKIFKMCI